MEEYTQPEGEVHLEPSRENRPSKNQKFNQFPSNREKGEKKSSKKERKMISYQKKLSPSGRSTMLVRVLSEKGVSTNPSPLSRN